MAPAGLLGGQHYWPGLDAGLSGSRPGAEWLPSAFLPPGRQLAALQHQPRLPLNRPSTSDPPATAPAPPLSHAPGRAMDLTRTTTAGRRGTLPHVTPMAQFSGGSSSGSPVYRVCDWRGNARKKDCALGCGLKPVGTGIAAADMCSWLEVGSWCVLLVVSCLLNPEASPTHPPTHPSTYKLTAASVWASRVVGWLLVWFVSLLEAWAEAQENRRAKSAAAAARRRCEEEAREREAEQRRDRDLEKVRQAQMAAVSSKSMGRRGGSGGMAVAVAPLQSVMSWQTAMLAQIEKEEAPHQQPCQQAAPPGGAFRRSGPLGSGTPAKAAPPLPAPAGGSAGGLDDRADSSSLLPPSPSPLSAARTEAGGVGGSGAGSWRDEGGGGEGQEAAGWGPFRLILNLDLSYLAEHVQVCAWCPSAASVPGVCLCGAGAGQCMGGLGRYATT